MITYIVPQKPLSVKDMWTLAHNQRIVWPSVGYTRTHCTPGVTMTRIMLVDDVIGETTTLGGLAVLSIRGAPYVQPHAADITGRLEIFQELAESDDPEFGTDARLAFKEAFGVELKDVIAILVPPGFDESIRLPESIRFRLVANSDGSITDMACAPAA